MAEVKLLMAISGIYSGFAVLFELASALTPRKDCRLEPKLEL
jgi:hypothetical protein